MSIYLYVKTHRKTGLKYLGKTEKNPHKYRGSGKYWKKHLRIHGYEIDTEILRECQSDEELREWGLYYSELWQVVESDKWANLKEEAGDGYTSEQARKIAKQKVVDGTHHWLGGEIQKKSNRKRVTDGTHHFLDVEFQRQTQQKRVEDGTHHFLDSEYQRQMSLKRVADGTHHWLGGEIQRKSNKKRLEEGTHHFQLKWTCSHCGKSGNGSGNFQRWHGDNCKSK